MINVDIETVKGWTKGKPFFMDAGFYAGRGPTPSDLNSPILEMLYEGIKKDVGDQAAVNFVRFVNQLDDLSASAFIVAFEQFAAQGGRVIKIEQREEDGWCITGHGAAGHAQAFAVLAHALCRPKLTEAELRSEHNRIKYKFIKNHEEEIPLTERRRM